VYSAYDQTKIIFVTFSHQRTAVCSLALNLADKLSQSLLALLNALIYLVPILCPNFNISTLMPPNTLIAAIINILI